MSQVWQSLLRLRQAAEALSPRQISVDETSYRKGHDYVTVVTDQEQSVVLHVAENRETGS